MFQQQDRVRALPQCPFPPSSDDVTRNEERLAPRFSSDSMTAAASAIASGHSLSHFLIASLPPDARWIQLKDGQACGTGKTK